MSGNTQKRNFLTWLRGDNECRKFVPVKNAQAVRLAIMYVLKTVYQERLVEQFYHAIKRHNAAFEREIVPLDLLTPQFVQPNRDNPRILKQDGAFIISGLDASDKESDNKMRKFLVKEIAIPKESKAQLRKELEYVGINQASLFPEVDKVADYLRKRD